MSESRVTTFRCDHEAVERWAELARDRNPLHLDPTFAATTRFGVPIVHGHLLACLVLDELQDALGRGLAYGGRVSVRFRAPVPVGAEVAVDVVVDDGGDPAVRVRADDVEVLEVDVTPARSATPPKEDHA